jgi:predicted nucleic acid-binding protein
MATYYLDSSALCKRYVAEAGAGWIASLFDPAQRHRLLVVRVTHVEIASALARRVREGTLSAAGQSGALRLFAYHLSQQLGVVEVDAALCEQAATLAADNRCAPMTVSNLPGLSKPTLSLRRWARAASPFSAPISNC